MITQCSHCGTKFEISTELVESDDPRVRCGECLEVFNAKLQLVPEKTFAEPVIPTVTQKVETAPAQQQRVESRSNPAVELEGYISAEDLENASTLALDDPAGTGRTNPFESGPSRAGSLPPTVKDEFYSPDLQVSLPASNKNIPTHDASDSRPDNEFEQTLVLDTHDESVSAGSRPLPVEPAIDTQAALDAVDESLEPALGPVAVEDPLDDAELAVEQQRARASDTTMYDNNSALELRRHVSRRGGEVLPIESAQSPVRVQQKSMLFPLVCVALVLAASLYFARDQIAALDLPEPVLTSFCSVTGCELPVKQDLTRLQLLQHRMNIHSRREDVLVINVDMINNAPFRQPYPVLAVTMSDKDGGIIAERKFQPGDYLESARSEETLPPGELVRIRFEILDPGPEAVASELVFE